MKTILEVLTLSSEHLKKKGVLNPRREAEDLLSDTLLLSRMDLYMLFDRPLTEKELVLCRENLARRAKGEPLQYIKGSVDFFDAKIKVNPHVLIPRQETEILVDKIANQLKKDEEKLGSLEGKVLFDVCTGSGCIGISLKKKFPQLRVILSDISLHALHVAKENADQNGCDVECLIGDLLEPFKGKKCDYFVINPPYIADFEYENLQIEVKGFEPKLALVSGPSGFEFYERLALELPGFLKSSARGFFEIGKEQGNRLLSLFQEAPWVRCRVESDWSLHDRFFFLEIE